MQSKDLIEIKTYWNKKYPHINVKLYDDGKGTEFFGNIVHAGESINLSANTIGELIAQGENFIRRRKNK